MNSQFDWSQTSQKMARQILDQGDKYLTAQLQSAIASDARATSLAGLFITLGVAVSGAGVAGTNQFQDAVFAIGGVTVGIALLLAAALCAWAARPIAFNYPGAEPKAWYAIRTDPLVEALGGEAENYDDRIDENAECLRKNGEALKLALIIAIASPFIGALAIGIWAIFA